MNNTIEQMIDARIVNALQKELKPLRIQVAKQAECIEELEANLVTFEKEVYSVSDLAELLNCSSDNVRKAYIKTGRIEAFKPKGSKGYCISKSEFKRVTQVVQTKGTYAL